MIRKLRSVCQGGWLGLPWRLADRRSKFIHTGPKGRLGNTPTAGGVAGNGEYSLTNRLKPIPHGRRIACLTKKFGDSPAMLFGYYHKVGAGTQAVVWSERFVILGGPGVPIPYDAAFPESQLAEDSLFSAQLAGAAVGVGEVTVFDAQHGYIGRSANGDVADCGMTNLLRRV